MVCTRTRREQLCERAECAVDERPQLGIAPARAHVTNEGEHSAQQLVAARHGAPSGRAYSVKGALCGRRIVLPAVED